MSGELGAQLARLPDLLGRHLALSLVALLIGVGISLPLAVVATRVRGLRGPLLGVASVIQTIPGLALLALMVPLLSRIGYVPAAIALVLYSVLPVLRNTITGIEGVDPDVVEAARGLGMTDGQILRRVELPIATPVILAGIRTATVWVVGMATLSTPVGATSLGNYIFGGLQTQNHVAVLVGCAAAAALALVLDGLLRLLELAAARRDRRIGLGAAAALVVLLATGLAPAALRGRSDPALRVRIGAKTFTEQYVLADVVAARVARAGLAPQHVAGLGSTIVFDALVAGEIDVYVDYTGTIWANHMRRTDTPGADAVLAELTRWLADEHDVVCLGRLGFENAYALAMRRDRAAELGVTTIDDLAGRARDLVLAGDYEFFDRPEWTALEEAYGLAFAEQRSLDATLMYAAVEQREVDAISAFTTDGRIAAFDLVLLDDEREALPPYDAVLLLSRAAARRPDLVGALRPLIDAIGDDAMRAANKRVDLDGASAREAAGELARAIEENIR